jgi:hypothetical protein
LRRAWRKSKWADHEQIEETGTMTGNAVRGHARRLGSMLLVAGAAAGCARSSPLPAAGAGGLARA